MRHQLVLELVSDEDDDNNFELKMTLNFWISGHTVFYREVNTLVIESNAYLVKAGKSDGIHAKDGQVVMSAAGYTFMGWWGQ
jgi:hypothetical protein